VCVGITLTAWGLPAGLLHIFRFNSVQLVGAIIRLRPANRAQDMEHILVINTYIHIYVYSSVRVCVY